MTEQIQEQQLVFVVDDDPIGLKLVTSILEESGYGTATATDGQQCLDEAAKIGPDLILMDISMPTMDGIVACRQLKKIPELESVPIVFVTANTDDETLQSAFEAGGSDYVRKPINRIELLARVNSALAQRRANEKQAEEERLKAALETAGGVCHKLNQPLQYVLGAIQIMMMDMDSNDPKFEHLDKVREKVEQMGEITSKMAKLTQYRTRAHAGGQHILDIEKSIQKPSDKE